MLDKSKCLAAMAYFADAICESEEIICACSEELAQELMVQKEHFLTALAVMIRIVRSEEEEAAHEDHCNYESKGGHG